MESPRLFFRLSPAAGGLLVVLSAAPAVTYAQSVVVFSDDFETPNSPLIQQCGNSLDLRGIDFLFGGPDVTYFQQFTVEGLQINDPPGLYSNPQGIGGENAIGMLGTFQDDRLAMVFDSQGRDFLNLGMDFSSISVPIVSGCGAPGGTATPVMQITLRDAPLCDGAAAFTGTVLDTLSVTGGESPDGFIFNWEFVTGSLSAVGSTDGCVAIEMDLTQGIYAAFDNLSIVASDAPGVVDGDTDGVADDEDNCPDVANPLQENGDLDPAGDACDPAPNDPNVCGDIDMDGTDDCWDLDFDGLPGFLECPLGGTGSHTFAYTGADQIFTVPPGVTEIGVKNLGCRGRWK